jgi:hypothetical protein
MVWLAQSGSFAADAFRIFFRSHKPCLQPSAFRSLDACPPRRLSMKIVVVFLILAFAVATSTRAQTNTAEHFTGVSAVFSNTLSVAGGAAEGSGAFAHGYSMATGDYAIAMGFGAMALHSNTFVWADRANPPVVSTSPGQFIVHATNGIYLLGGKIYGNASGLTSVNVNAISGLGSSALKRPATFATAAQGQTANAAYNTANSALQADGRVVWTATQNAAGQSLTNLQAAYALAVTQAHFKLRKTVWSVLKSAIRTAVFSHTKASIWVTSQMVLWSSLHCK